jgi:IS30 family transposase
MQFYSHLSDDERDQIAILRAAGRSMEAIARALGRAKTNISRELQRNALPSGGYSPLHAAGAHQPCLGGLQRAAAWCSRSTQVWL